MTNDGEYWGKYRGTVLQNVDPLQQGRLLLTVPDVLSLLPTTWAEACVPLSGPTGPPMGVYMVPSIGAAVWVEFEHGDPDLPVWVGCRWDLPIDVPPLALVGNPLDPNIVIQTLFQHTLMLSDMPPTPMTGGIILKTLTNAMIVVNDSGVYLQNGKGASIWMVGPTVYINNQAFTVT